MMGHAAWLRQASGTFSTETNVKELKVVETEKKASDSLAGKILANEEE